MKLWKKILIILLIVVAVFVIFTLRKMFILISLDKKVSELENTKNNIYAKMVSKIDGNTTESEIFIKNEIYKSSFTIKDEEKTTLQVVQMTYPNERKVFNINENEKTLRIYNEKAPVRGADLEYSGEASYSVIVNFAHATILPERLMHSLFTKIKEVELDGKECYELIGSEKSLFIRTNETEKIYGYVEKETGLPIKRIDVMKDGSENITTYEYKFDIVTDEDLKEPDASEYKVQE